jgi:hypothetical protein
VSGWRTTSWAITFGVALLTLAACGAGERQDANEPSGRFPVHVSAASFPSIQRLGEQTELVIAVRNAGRRTIPDIAVTITNPRYGTTVQPFATFLNLPNLASHSRPVWIVQRPPGPCGYSCRLGGPGAAVTADPHTWALGTLRPGTSAKFVWGVTAVKPGTYKVSYQIAAGLNGKARAILADGSEPRGTFTARIRRAPARVYVNGNGQVIKTG